MHNENFKKRKPHVTFTGTVGFGMSVKPINSQNELEPQLEINRKELIILGDSNENSEKIYPEFVVLNEMTDADKKKNPFYLNDYSSKLVIKK